MSVGGFIFIFVCVMTCETRDKVFELMGEGKMTSLIRNPDFYDLIIETMKLKEERYNSG